MKKHYVMKTEKQAIAKAKAELRKELGGRLYPNVTMQNQNSYCSCGETLGKKIATWNATQFYSKTVAVCENCYNDWQD
ncbi:MAG: hypothetical protein IT237_04365 [Bacteroidia bacterium]|nr:hypothetical protein [Bacteroidia bacterium]